MERDFSVEKYTLKLIPDFKTYKTFKGELKIEGIVASGINKIKLDSDKRSIQILSVEIADKLTEWSIDEKNLFINPQKEVAFPAIIKIQFLGNINNSMKSFYYSTMDATGPEVPEFPLANKTVLSTQFEAQYARQTFPCLDSPSAKAVFSFSVVFPAALADVLTVLTNTEETTRKETDGCVEVQFADTPKMSTYLLAWAIGPFGKPLVANNVRVFALPAYAEQTAFALQIAARALPFFEKLFRTPFPFRKLDLLALPEFGSGAMENWGLVTFRDSCLFVSEQSSVAQRKRVATVVVHELAHMWFGNLVTMRDWDDLWLNEGFATFVEYVGAAELLAHPGLERDMLVNSSAMETDALTVCEPVKTVANQQTDVLQLFDELRYAKAGAVLRMVRDWLGADVFLDGVALYLREFVFANADCDELFALLSKSAGQSVTAVMDSFIKQSGVPLIKLTPISDNKVRVEQNRFLTLASLTGQSQSCDNLWEVPLFLDRKKTVLNKKSIEVPFDFLLANWRASGYYLVDYPETHLETIAKTQGLDALSLTKVVGDVVTLAEAGRYSLPFTLSFLAHFANSSDPYLLSIIYGFYCYLAKFDFPKYSSLLTALVRSNTAVQRMLAAVDTQKTCGGLPFKTYSSVDNSNAVFNLVAEEQESLCRLVLRTLVFCEDEDTVRLAKEFARSPTFITAPTALKDFVYDALILDTTFMDARISEYSDSVDSEERNCVLNSLGRVNNEEAIGKVFAFAMSERVRLQDKLTPVFSLLLRSRNKKAVLKELETHIQTIFGLYQEDEFVSKIVECCASYYDEESLSTVKRLFENNEDCSVALRRTCEEIEINIEFWKYLKSLK